MNFRNRNIIIFYIFGKICTEVGSNLFLTIIKIFLAAQMYWNVKNTKWTCIFRVTAPFYPKAFENGTFSKNRIIAKKIPETKEIKRSKLYCHRVNIFKVIIIQS